LTREGNREDRAGQLTARSKSSERKNNKEPPKIMISWLAEAEIKERRLPIT